MFEETEKKGNSLPKEEAKPTNQSEEAKKDDFSLPNKEKAEDIFSGIQEPATSKNKKKEEKNELKGLQEKIKKSNFNFYLKIGAIIILFILVIGGIFAAVSYGIFHLINYQEKKISSMQNKFVQDFKQMAPSTSSSPEEYATSTKSQVKNGQKDSDHDGLSDAEERKLGTNPYKADTDGDGLTDYQEVKIYHTDPLNPDTDGDGYSDGEEVSHGYNPLGPGKLKN